MSELHFFMTADDTQSFLQWLEEQYHPTFVHSWSLSPELPAFTNVQDLLTFRAAGDFRNRYFLMSEAWSVWPSVTKRIDHTDGTTSYYFNEREGGPALDLSLSRIDSENDQSFVVRGDLSAHSNYYVPAKARFSIPIARPTAMTAAFAAASNYMRRLGYRSVCAEHDGRLGPWILPGALAQHQAGGWLRIGDLHFLPRSSPTNRSKSTRPKRRAV